MSKLTAVILVAVVGVLMLAMDESGLGQSAPTSDLAVGKGLRDAPQKFIKAFQAGDHEGMFSQMATWRQDGVALEKEKFEGRLSRGEVTDEKLQKLIGRIDPKGTLKLKNADSMRALSPQQYFALFGRFVAATSTRDPNSQKMQWYEVHRTVGWLMPQWGDAAGRSAYMPWGGTSEWENAAGDSISFTLTIDDTRWSIDSVIVTLTTGRASSTMLSSGGADPQAVSEGEQLLGSARDYTRVEYSKNGIPPADIYDFADEHLFTGAHYKVRGAIHQLSVAGDQRYDVAIVAEPTEGFGLWLTMRFQWASGQNKIEQHEDEEAVKAAIKSWQ